MMPIHFAKLVPEQAKKLGHKPVMRYRDEAERSWKDISWTEFNRDVQRAASSLIDSGVKEQVHVGLFSQNKPECLVVDFAIYSIRAVGVPMYATCTTAQIVYMLNDAGIELLFVGEQYQYDRAFEAMNAGCCLKQLVIFDTSVRLAVSDNISVYFKDFLQKGYINDHGPEVEQRRKDASPKDLANILYTSGTSGDSKGVLLTHAMFQEAMRVNDLKLRYLSANEVSLCFLPMSHIFEKAWDLFCLMKGYRVDINLNPMAIQMILKEVRPTVMCSVPRFWEKIHAGIYANLNSKPAYVRVLFQRGVSIGKKFHLDYKRNGLRPPFWLWASYCFYSQTIFHIVKKTIGIERGTFFPVAGAKLSEELCDFFRSIGVRLVLGYGLTESTATVSCLDQTHYYTNTAGSIIDGLQVKIGADQEILLKGKTITPGYYNRPEITEASFTKDGFFRTGDAGAIDEHGHLIITERIKDLFKTSNGKYIAPQQIETALSKDPYIDMAAVIGDGCQYVSALIVPNLKEVQNLAASLGVTADTTEALLKDDRLYVFFEDHIRKLQKNMAGFEQIRRFTLLSKPFSVEEGELTNTLKLRRKVIAAHYAEIIQGMY
ncbi:MAG: long-chain fatty acid--CoA ligase [Bacteroidota bacterium]|nr:long-chain fatty acid--CoA ligase [Bacteroidota bacterium]